MSDTKIHPLADKMRPESLEQFFGQEHILASGKPLRTSIETGNMHSMIFWGPPGTGKTTLARLISHYCGANFLSISAVLSGVKDIREAIAKARLESRATILFVDEVHRFNKSQQDAFLPHIEDGTITFIGATTENPSFELNNALLSRARVYVLKTLNDAELRKIIDRVLSDSKHGLGEHQLELNESARKLLISASDGDARRLLNFIEIASDFAHEGKVDENIIRDIVSEGVRRYDKGGEYFYDQISALHKSVRGSSPDAALYWFARMIDGGCDPHYLARRIVRMASEDIGNADPRGLQIALNAWDAMDRLGSPEGELALAQAVVYLASAAKSNAVYKAFGQVRKDVQQYGSLEVPMKLRNSPTNLMKSLGYSEGYRYAHDEPEGYAAGENYFPDEMPAKNYYQPVDRGLEQKIRQKLEYLRQLDKKAKK